MVLDYACSREHLKNFDFEPLFIEELGWDRHDETLNVSVNGEDYRLVAIAHKRGMVAFLYNSPSKDKNPDYQTRKKIEQQVAKSIREHLIIYTDPDKNNQIWQWVKKEVGRPAACREHQYHKNQNGDSLLQKLQSIAFCLEEEEELNIVDVTQRIRAAFDVDKITKKFFERFKKEHGDFLKFIEGIEDVANREWYASIMLNRLMFIYFIQKKGFLDGDNNYLQNRLGMTKEKKGKNTFFTFYRHFLMRLFHEGLGQQKRTDELDKLLGKVPYLNGGLFDVHELERDYKDIQIPDEAFEKILAYFDQYQWHLDERPLQRDNEINPDVLGYIFEKYINQKQMGAYYTKEDITDYISKNTIIPRIFDMVEESFGSIDVVWNILKQNPDRYIYDAVMKGVDEDLPEDIAVGIKDVSKRDKWNELASEEYALPTEIWREVVARRQRYEEVHSKLTNEEIKSINDLITYNLDIQQFAQDVVETTDDPKLLMSFFTAISKISVLDPTCGSGAFLFAALNILESLYEACLERMRAFVAEKNGEKENLAEFQEIFQNIEEHPNQRYYILKSIILNNLYGVDIMDEAVEICKLRFFLKLVAQLEKVEQVEPLPDIDFNIRAGNTLVGFTTLKEVKKAIFQANDGQLKLVTKIDDKILNKIIQKAERVEEAYKIFRNTQIQKKLDHEALSEAKKKLRQQLAALRNELNMYQASEYGIKVAKGGTLESYEYYNEWLTSHKPFHWFVEFYEIIREGGFDVSIGNPPYVEYSKVRKKYTISKRLFKTEKCGNLFAFILETSYNLLHEDGRQGFIVPISLVSTQRMEPLQDSILNNSYSSWHSTYAERPSKLFNGAEVLLAISLFQKRRNEFGFNYVTGLRKWNKEERPALFETTNYELIEGKLRTYILPKLSSPIEKRIIKKFWETNGVIGDSFLKKYDNKIYYRIGGGRYWKIFTTFQPLFILNGEKSVSSRENYIYFSTPQERDCTVAIFSSTLFYWYFIVTTNGRDLNPSDLKKFPISLTNIGKKHYSGFVKLASLLMEDYKANKIQKEKKSQQTGHIVYEEFYPRESKHILDKIDGILADHYGFTEEELDFILNYEIKYRI